jgi:hypothetical protein
LPSNLAIKVNILPLNLHKGTCTKLEKSYFRLTSAVDPSEVRPENVLKKTLKLLVEKWKNKEADYKYIDD